LLYAVVPPPVTPLMLIRALEGHGISKAWVPLARISPHLQRAVIAAEDAKFCTHGGFDWEAVDTAIERRRRGGRVLGASTISMQTAKNLFLWPARTYFRKGGEVYITVWLETLLSKRRILELYLNVIELGPGIYGAEAAARHFFGVGAGDLSPAQAAQLASVLPSPLNWRPAPGGRAGTIEVRARSVEIDSDGPC
ncbi:MAG: monofunctional biosynthetic peptidoglycan transglycosylase, partial [Parvibaculum sp.]